MTILRVFVVPEDASNGEWKAQFYSDNFKKLVFEKTGSINVQADPVSLVIEGKEWIKLHKQEVLKELEQFVKKPELIFEN